MASAGQRGQRVDPPVISTQETDSGVAPQHDDITNYLAQISREHGLCLFDDDEDEDEEEAQGNKGKQWSVSGSESENGDGRNRGEGWSLDRKAILPTECDSVEKHPDTVTISASQDHGPINRQEASCNKTPRGTIPDPFNVKLDPAAFPTKTTAVSMASDRLTGDSNQGYHADYGGAQLQAGEQVPNRVKPRQDLQYLRDTPRGNSLPPSGSPGERAPPRWTASFRGNSLPTPGYSSTMPSPPRMPYVADTVRQPGGAGPNGSTMSGMYRNDILDAYCEDIPYLDSNSNMPRSPPSARSKMSGRYPLTRGHRLMAPPSPRPRRQPWGSHDLEDRDLSNSLASAYSADVYPILQPPASVGKGSHHSPAKQDRAVLANSVHAVQVVDEWPSFSHPYTAPGQQQSQHIELPCQPDSQDMKNQRSSRRIARSRSSSDMSTGVRDRELCDSLLQVYSVGDNPYQDMLNDNQRQRRRTRTRRPRKILRSSSLPRRRELDASMDPWVSKGFERSQSVGNVERTGRNSRARSRHDDEDTCSAVSGSSMASGSNLDRDTSSSLLNAYSVGLIDMFPLDATRSSSVEPGQHQWQDSSTYPLQVHTLPHPQYMAANATRKGVNVTSAAGNTIPRGSTRPYNTAPAMGTKARTGVVSGSVVDAAAAAAKVTASQETEPQQKSHSSATLTAKTGGWTPVESAITASGDSKAPLPLDTLFEELQSVISGLQECRQDELASGIPCPDLSSTVLLKLMLGLFSYLSRHMDSMDTFLESHIKGEMDKISDEFTAEITKIESSFAERLIRLEQRMQTIEQLFRLIWGDCRRARVKKYVVSRSSPGGSTDFASQSQVSRWTSQGTTHSHPRTSSGLSHISHTSRLRRDSMLSEEEEHNFLDEPSDLGRHRDSLCVESGSWGCHSPALDGDPAPPESSASLDSFLSPQSETEINVIVLQDGLCLEGLHVKHPEELTGDFMTTESPEPGVEQQLGGHDIQVVKQGKDSGGRTWWSQVG